MTNNCTTCPLNTHKRVRMRGPTDADILLLGEAPGREEEEQGKPFVGKSGRELSNYLLYSNIPESRCAFTNVVACRPPGNRDPEPNEIECCHERLMNDLFCVKPRLVITLGRFAMDALLQERIRLDKVHGLPFPSTFAHQGESFSTTVIPLYHPAYAFHKQDIMIHMQTDFRRIRQWMDGAYERPLDITHHRYEVVDNVVDLLGVINGGLELIAIDTEWAQGKPWCLSFSVKYGEGYVVMAESVQVVKALNDCITESGATVILHNATYDLPVLEQMGIVPTRFVDTMQMAYLLQDEPQGLKALAYRHLGVDMDDYLEVTGVATQQKAIDYVWSLYDHEWPMPPHEHYIKDGVEKVRKPWSMERKLNRIVSDVAKDDTTDVFERWSSKGNTWYREQAEAVVGPLRAGELCDIDYDTAIHYAAQDADVTMGIYPILEQRIEEAALDGMLTIDMKMLPFVMDMSRHGAPVSQQKLCELQEVLTASLVDLENQIYELTNKHINPGSHDQVKDLLVDMSITQRRLKSADKEHLSNYTDHEVVRLILEHKKLIKLKSTYTNPLQKGHDRIYTKWLVTRTTTGRLASKNPNLMNIPVRTKEGQKIRECFVAPEGRVLIGCDYSQGELRLGAHMSQDEVMIEKFLSGRDIHSETAIEIYGSDDKDYRSKAKTVNFGIFYGLSAMGMAKREGWPEQECQQIIDEWFRLYKGVKKWIDWTISEAKRTGCTRDLFGRRRLIPQVRSSDGRIKEEGLRQAVNNPIQSGLGSIVKVAMAKMIPHYRTDDTDFFPILQVHDELIVEASERDGETVASIMQTVMEGAVLLSVPLIADPTISKDWGGLK